eukprot:CAMPEP_0202865352 /NCGR_PEP_ID=MMETSP1391-20130828/5782_1 /ASSEMBLY_ACC=CAM_ASM_000867 /TAXON_ID=1034604 /ORGANISM="Chlamydomonas leiostraca, Strain SAG 11-49" /LENGTH=58 /DNA_ID=CAMNT_0049545187 /DNA_START=92 /DNA_END=268 /DNA_ORIENTATION=-
MTEYPDVARYVAIPCGLFFASSLVVIVWGAVMWIQSRAEEARLKKEKEDKAAALKARA